FRSVLVLSLPASAAISVVQSQASWNVTGTNTCQAIFTTTGSHDLMAVWVSWTTSGTNTITASATDSSGVPYSSAVGPTVQAASNTAAQIFYLQNIGGGPNTVTVTF